MVCYCSTIIMLQYVMGLLFMKADNQSLPGMVE